MAIVAATRTFGAMAEDLLVSVRPDLLLVYLEGIDSISHRFVKDRRRGPLAIERAYRDADDLVSRLAARADPRTWIVVCSDHGFYPATAAIREDPAELTGPATAWHRPYGIVAAAEAGLLAGASSAGAGGGGGDVGMVGPLDIAPTLLHALGLPTSLEMPGRVVTALLPPEAASRPVARVRSYEPARRPEVASASAPDPEAHERLQALGYVGASTTSLARLNLGEILYRGGKLQEAERELRTVVDAQPTNVPALLWLAKTVRDQGRGKAALELYAQALAQAGDNGDALVEAVDLAAEAGLPADARRLAEGPSARRASPPAAAVSRAIAARAEGRPEAGERELRAALATEPTFFPALTRLLDLLVAAGRPADARSALDRAAADAPESASHLALAGEAALAAGDPAAAVTLARAGAPSRARRGAGAARPRSRPTGPGPARARPRDAARRGTLGRAQRAPRRRPRGPQRVGGGGPGLPAGARPGPGLAGGVERPGLGGAEARAAILGRRPPRAVPGHEPQPARDLPAPRRGPAGVVTLSPVAPEAAAGRRRLVAGLVLFVVAAGGAALLLVRPRPRPNVLLVTIDTLRADRLGCYGYGPAATPILDALAARGVRFTTAVAHAPLTAPSHASILTGLLPLGHGVRDNGAFVLPPSPTTLAEVFRDAGYRTAAFVSGFPLDHRFGFARGFETYDDQMLRGRDSRRTPYVERTAVESTRRAVDWIRAAPAPWFVWVHYFDPHAPYEPPGELAARFASSPYDGEIASVDRELGRLLTASDTAPSSALVLVTSDHGESLGEHGEATHGVFVYDATLRVPWIMAGPGIARGRVSSVVARGIDVAPTLLDYAGLRVPRGLQGRSLRPAANGREMPDAPAYAESLFCRLNLGWAELHAWRTARWKLVEAPRPELYDLDADPAETRDVSVDREDEAEALRSALRRALEARPPDASTVPGNEVRERLRALGYVGGSAPARPTRRDPKDGIALVERLERGLVEARAHPAVAMDELSAFLAEEPDAPLARRYRAIAFQFAGRYDDAVADIRALEAKGPLSLEDLTVLAESLRLAGRHEEALAALDRAASLDPRAPEPALLRGRTLRAMGRSEEAGAALRQALALDPAGRRGAARAGRAGARAGGDRRGGFGPGADRHRRSDGRAGPGQAGCRARARGPGDGGARPLRAGRGPGAEQRRGPPGPGRGPRKERALRGRDSPLREGDRDRRTHDDGPQRPRYRPSRVGRRSRRGPRVPRVPRARPTAGPDRRSPAAGVRGPPVSRSRRRRETLPAAPGAAPPSRRWAWVGLGAVALGAAGTLLLLRHHPAPATSRPGLNVLLVTLDTTRADRLGCYGYAPGKTRHLDRLAVEGARFETVVAPAPITLPSHSSILTGLYPFEHGVRNNGNFYLAGRFETLATRLKARGYRTGAFVSSFILDRRYGLDRGFDVYDDRMEGEYAQVVTLQAERRGDRTALALGRWIDERAKEPEAPFFAWLHLYDPHEPYRPPHPFRDLFPKDPYDGEIAFIDAIVASVLDRLQAARLLDRTLVVVTGDHGESLGEHGETTHSMFLYEAAIRVPLVLWRPGLVPPDGWSRIRCASSTSRRRSSISSAPPLSRRPTHGAWCRSSRGGAGARLSPPTRRRCYRSST